MFLDDIELFSHEFEVVNTTNRPVRIVDRQCECACSVADLGKENLLPGETTNLRVSRRIGPPGGLVTLACSLLTDCPEMRQWRYAVEVPVYARSRLSPARLVFGSVEAGGKVTRSLQFESYRPAGEPHPRLLGGSSEHIRLTIAGETVENTSIHGVVSRVTPLLAELDLEPNEANGMGDQTETVLLSLDSDDSTTRHESMVATWFVRAPIEVSPRCGFFFGRVHEAAGIETRTVLLRSSDVPFAIQGVELPHSAFLKPEYDDETKGRLHIVKFHLNCAEVSGAVTGEVVLNTDHPEQRVVIIRYAALRN